MDMEPANNAQQTSLIAYNVNQLQKLNEERSDIPQLKVICIRKALNQQQINALSVCLQKVLGIHALELSIRLEAPELRLEHPFREVA